MQKCSYNAPHKRQDVKRDEEKIYQGALRDSTTVTGFDFKLARATRISDNKVIAPVAERHVKVFILQTRAEQLERASELRKQPAVCVGARRKSLSATSTQ